MLTRRTESTAMGIAMPHSGLLYVIGGIVVIAAILVYLSLNPTNHTTALFWLNGAACLILFIVADLLGETAGRNQQAGFVHLAVMTVLLVSSPLIAAAVITTGTLLSGLMQVGLGQWTSIVVPTRREIARHALLRLGSSLPALIVAWLVYSLLGGTWPFLATAGPQIGPGLAALLVSFLVVRGINRFFTRWTGEIDLDAVNGTLDYRSLLTELTLLAIPLALAVAAGSDQPGLFLVMMGILTVNVMRRWRYSHVEARQQLLEEQNNTLLHKLSLVNLSIQNAMFNVDQSEAIKTACETAMAVTKANKAAVFLIEREKETLQLVESIGLTEIHRQLERDLPYQPEMYSVTPRIVPDTEQSVIPVALRDFARKARFRAFAEIPLRSGNVMMGYLSVFHQQPHLFTETELNLIDILVNQLTAALDNAHLLRTLEIHAFEMTHLVHLSRIASSSLDMDIVARDISVVLQQMTGMDYVGIGLAKPGDTRLNLLGTPRIIPAFPELHNLQTHHQATTIQVAEASDALRPLMESQALATLHLMPMVAHEDPLGVIMLGSSKARLLIERESQLLEAAANQIATHISNLTEYLRTQEALQEQLEQASLIEDLVRKIATARDYNPQILVNDIFEATFQTTPADSVSLAVRTDAGDVWLVEQVRDQDGFQRYYFQQDVSVGIIGKVFASGLPYILSDNSEDPDYILVESGPYRSSLVVPMMIESTVIGVLNVESLSLNAFTDTQMRFLQNLASHATISLENGQLLEELHYQVKTLQNLRQLAVTLTSAENPTAVHEVILKTAASLAEAQYAILYRYNPRIEQLELLNERYGDNRTLSVLERNAFNYIAQRAVFATEAEVQTTLSDLIPAGTQVESRIASLITVPIMRSFQVTEVIALGFAEQTLFETRLLNALNLMAIQAAGHLDNVMLYTQVREGSDRMKAILTSARDGVIMLDTNGKLTDYNPAAQRMLGVNLSDHIGESLVETLLRYANEREGELLAGYSSEELRRLARIYRLDPQNITRREFATQMPNKSMVYVEEIGSPVYDEDYRLMGRMLTLRDISDEKALEKVREEITSMAVHDLRAPLASIINALRIALENMGLPGQFPVAEQTINMSLVSADKLMNIIESLLTIQKGRSMTLDRTSVSIEELIELARWTLLSSVEKANLKLTVTIPPDTPQVYVDSEKIRRVIINLLDNAIRYTPSGEEIRLWVVEDRARGKLVVHVADSGPGIPFKERERVFEQFWQVKSNQPLRGTKGNGIGLAFVSRVLEAHGEKIQIEDISPLNGAHFSFTLPVELSGVETKNVDTGPLGELDESS